MLIAGEASGDANAADLVRALGPMAPGSEFFGAGGPRMAAAGVELAHDMTTQSNIGLDFIKNLALIRRIFAEMIASAVARRPDAVILVDFGEFNQRFARALRQKIRSSPELAAWKPKIIRYVSPQVWASRPGRADSMARDIDLLLCLFPFEKEWYAKRVPQLRVECVGHPILDRHEPGGLAAGQGADGAEPPLVAILPGSRNAELRRHLPPMLGAARLIAREMPARFEMILPTEALAAKARQSGAADIAGLQIKIGGLSETLSRATIAITKTGTITLECAFYGVPAIAIYKTLWITYFIGRRIVTVPFLTMPNLLAGHAVFPELLQGDATTENIAREALALLRDGARRREVAVELAKIVQSLGGPGAAKRAARAIIELMAR